jgi:hypothetical protein
MPTILLATLNARYFHPGSPADLCRSLARLDEGLYRISGVKGCPAFLRSERTQISPTSAKTPGTAPIRQARHL